MFTVLKTKALRNLQGKLNEANQKLRSQDLEISTLRRTIENLRSVNASQEKERLKILAKLDPLINGTVRAQIQKHPSEFAKDIYQVSVCFDPWLFKQMSNESFRIIAKQVASKIEYELASLNFATLRQAADRAVKLFPRHNTLS